HGASRILEPLGELGDRGDLLCVSHVPPLRYLRSTVIEKHFVRCVGAGDSKTPRREAHGAATPALVGPSDTAQFTCAGCPVPGSRDPGRSLRPSRVTASSGLRRLQGTDSVLRFKTHSPGSGLTRLRPLVPGMAGAPLRHIPSLAHLLSRRPALAHLLRHRPALARGFPCDCGAVKSDFCHTSIAPAREEN